MECLNKLLNFSVIAILVLISLNSCYYDNKEELLQNVEQTACDTTTALTYDAQVGTILNNSCTLSGCHNTQTNQSGYDFSQYSTAKTAVDNDRLAAVLNSGSMPKSPGTISNCDKQAVIKWINNGAPEN